MVAQTLYLLEPSSATGFFIFFDGGLGSGERGYLDALEKVAKLVSEKDYDDEALAKNIGIDRQNLLLDQRELDQKEPGLLDYTGEGVKIFSGLNDIFSWF